jgi:HK97 family phage major capsid protein
MDNVKQVLDAQAAAFEALKSANEARLKAVEEKAGQGDHLAKMDKINQELDQLAERLKATEAAVSRAAVAPAAATTDEHKQAFGQWLRRGDRAIDAIKGMRVSDNENGGYLVPESVVGPLVQRLFDGSPMRQVARVQAITGNAIEGVVSYGQLEVEWLDEVSASSDPTTPTLKRYRAFRRCSWRMVRSTSSSGFRNRSPATSPSPSRPRSSRVLASAGHVGSRPTRPQPRLTARARGASLSTW